MSGDPGLCTAGKASAWTFPEANGTRFMDIFSLSWFLFPLAMSTVSRKLDIIFIAPLQPSGDLLTHFLSLYSWAFQLPKERDDIQTNVCELTLRVF